MAAIATIDRTPWRRTEPNHQAEPVDPIQGPGALPGYAELRTLAEMYADAQQTRIALQHRADRADIDPTVLHATLHAAKVMEHECGKAMRAQYRRTTPPGIREWAKGTRGVGENLLIARLLGAIGHPVHTTKHRWEGTGSDRKLVVVGPYQRRVSDLWSYCGHGDPDRKPRRGMTADEAAAAGNPRAKMLVHLLAEAQVKSRGEYRHVYDEARAKYAEREGWTELHRHNAALRLVGKHLLMDLWLAAGGGGE